MRPEGADHQWRKVTVRRQAGTEGRVLIPPLLATQRLLKGISVYTLAENMGTSVAMIEKHYGHLKPEMAADELTKE